jgi:hypothetical protein
LDGAPPEPPILFDVLRCPNLTENLNGGQLRQPGLLDRGIDRSQQLIAISTDRGANSRRSFSAFGQR